MKEARFRAWDRVQKKMSYVVTVYSEGDEWGWYADHVNPDTDNTICSFDEPAGDLMMYARIKDRNDLKVFQEDIVEFRDPYNKEVTHGYWRVSYEEGNGFWFFERFDVPPESWKMLTFSALNICKGREYITVVGNTYEKPELLK